MRLNLVGQVDEDMLTQVLDFLAEKPTSAEVIICSEGGDPDIALAIAGLLKELPRITTRAYGQCFSAATLIFAVGQKRAMQKWTLAMVHETSDKVSGNSSAIKYFAKNMEKMENHWNAVMAELTGTDAKVWEKLNERDTYLSAEECLKLNLATEIF